MEQLRKSQVDQLVSSDRFLWLTGIEDTFITAPWPKTGRTLDEYELTEHYQRWNEDIELMAQLGVQSARYGVPWHRINPAPGQWDWSFADKTLERLIEVGIDPIVDLVHYGLPPWIENAFLNPDFPAYMAEYSSRLAERFKGRIHAYTPLNEPRVTSWYCGKLGWWPPFQKGWKGFVQVMLGVCRGIVQTTEALEEVDPEILPVHVDATDLYESDDPSLAEEVTRRQDIVFLALDLISGRVDESHSLYHWLLKNGAGESDLDYFLEHALELSLIGINLYPLFSRKVLAQSKYGLRTRMPYSVDSIVERLGQMYFDRYHAPIFISETASVGSVKRRREWLDASLEQVKALRSRGVPMVGYTWWPMFALVTWAYRQGDHPPAYYLKQMGLWDLDEKLDRVPTSLVKDYQQLVSCGAACVGQLRAETIIRG
ncbi:MAG: glycoside hydrolase family 1 protein [Verrucomicrobia bacterium]|jgi:beta-glucosidase/6-phospho-beta-glucosidase/beta-galactosidase|nr:glycoside hydrolase family 1 protein [Verrucomicrobiota bacterium]